MTRRKKILTHLSKVSLALLSTSLLLSTPVYAVDPALSEGGKEALNAALKIARSKPSLSICAGLTCAACIPVAGSAASPALCIACGILIAKTLG